MTKTSTYEFKHEIDRMFRSNRHGTVYVEKMGKKYEVTSYSVNQRTVKLYHNDDLLVTLFFKNFSEGEKTEKPVRKKITGHDFSLFQ